MQGSRLYWVLVALLIPFGVVTGFSIGIPFLLLGILLVWLSPVRHQRAAFWPPIIGLVTFVAVYILTVPQCSSISTNGGPTQTTCRVLFTFEYERVGANYNAPLGPALLAGVAAGVVVGLGARRLIRARQSATESGEVQPNGM